MRTLIGLLLVALLVACGNTTEPTNTTLARSTSNAVVAYSDTAVTPNGLTVAFRVNCTGLSCKFTNLSSSTYPLQVKSPGFIHGTDWGIFTPDSVGTFLDHDSRLSFSRKLPAPGSYYVNLFQQHFDPVTKASVDGFAPEVSATFVLP